MQVNVATREVTCKVVYYGPGMSGKTTNLKIIHERAPRKSVGELITLDTHSERTLHFDLLPMDLGVVRGFSLRFEFFTVPGQSYYAATRRLVLEGADAVVFVADSRREALDENIDSMNDLLDNLRHHQLPEDLPVVIQYNKQDLSTALKPEQLDPLLNIRRWQRFIAVATAGQGVLETLNSVAALVVERVKQHPALAAPSGAAPALLAAATAPANRTWLITCYRCQNMLEITNAKTGDLFTCGACGTALEINNLEHGVTRAPLPAALSAGATQPLNMNEEVGPGSGGYSMQPLGAVDGPALHSPQGSGAQASTPGGMPFEIDGFDQLALLDETVQGRRFRVKERSTGTAWRALVISPTLMRQPGYQPQLEPYARLAAQIKHQHILPLSSLRAGRETPVLLSAAPADYESLAHVLARRRTLAPPHALGVARMVALALEEAARHGVVHGWLRPDVILLSPDGNTLVDEFGLPKHHRYLVRELAGASAATEYYLAPEHLSDDARSDARSDIFMLGALLFRMMTGEGLVTGYNAHEALHKISASGCRNLRAVNPQISRDLDAFFVRMVAVERRDRFQNYRELVDQLDKFGGGAKRGTLRLTGSVNAANPGTRPQRAPGGRVGGVTSAARRTVGGSGGHRTLPPSAEAHAPARRQDDSNAFLIVAGVLLVVALVGAMLYLSNKGGNVGYSPSRTASDTSSGDKQTTFPVARDLYANHGRDRDKSQTVIERATARPPNAGTATPGTGAPTTATKIEPPKTPVKAPTVGNAAVAPTNLNRGDLSLQISTLEREEHFGEALTLCRQLDVSTDTETRDWASERANDVLLRHDNRRKDVLSRLATAADVAEAETLLARALDGTWGMEGDVEWAQDQLASARARLPHTRPADPTPGTAATAPAADTTPATADATAGFAAADAELEQALVAGQTATIEQILAKLDQNAPQSKALRRKAELWASRADILGSIIRSRKPKLRLPHPTIGEQWDVTDAERGGVQITSPAGSSTRLEWTQVAIKDLGRIAREAADHPQAESRDYALACILLLMSGDTAMASVQTIKGKAAIDEPTGRDLDALIALKRGRELDDAIVRADAAATAGDIKALDEALTALKRLDRDNKQPRARDALTRLEPVRARMSEGKTTAGDVAAKDDLTFDAEDDLQSFPLRQGVWHVGGGQASLVGESGSLARKDLGNARSLTLVFQNNGGKGAMTVNFRGVRVLAEFGGNRITVASREQESRGKEFVFLPKTVHSIYLRANREAGTMAIEVNNGAEVFEIKSGALNDQLTISADNNAAIAIEEISIGRGGSLPQAHDPATTARHEAVRNQTGCEPLGGVYLDPPTIVLPAPDKGIESGLAFPLRESAASITFDVKGKGQLQFLLGQLGKDGGDFVAVDLKPDPQRLTVSWRGALVVKNEQGLVVAENKNLGKDHTHLMIVAGTEAILMVSPKLNRE